MPVTVEEALRQGVPYVGPVRGTSMRPLIRAGRDRVAIVPVSASDPLRLHDVVLLCLNGHLILHRVVACESDRVTLLGDGSCIPERDVPRACICGRMEGLWRDGRAVDLSGGAYRAYVRAWTALAPVRCTVLRLRSRASRMVKGKRS